MKSLRALAGELNIPYAHALRIANHFDEREPNAGEPSLFLQDDFSIRSNDNIAVSTPSLWYPCEVVEAIQRHVEDGNGRVAEPHVVCGGDPVALNKPADPKPWVDYAGRPIAGRIAAGTKRSVEAQRVITCPRCGADNAGGRLIVCWRDGCVFAGGRILDAGAWNGA